MFNLNNRLMNELPLSILDTNEFYIASVRTLGVAKPALSTDVYASKLCGRISGGNLNLEHALGKSLKSNFTTQQRVGDKSRDSRFVGFTSHLKSCIHGKDAVVAAAAMNLYEIVRTIGTRIHRLGYKDQTVKMNALIERLTTPEATQWLKTANATSLFEDMVDDQKEFEGIFKDKVEVEGAIDIPLIRESKAIIGKALTALLVYIESNVEGDTTSVFKPLEDKINEIITDVMTMAHARITREENEKKNENPPK